MAKNQNLDKIDANFEDEAIGAIKIKDGLFIGDKFASQVILLFYFCRIWNL
jgi:hypothetical protein